MKIGTPIRELTKELQRQAAAKVDHLADVSEMRLEGGQIHFKGGFEVNDIAHGQIAEYLGIPKAFYDDMRSRNLSAEVRSAHPGVSRSIIEDIGGADDPKLFDVACNTLLHQKDGKRLLRTLDGRVRAFLSDRFNVDIDNYDVLRMAAKAISEVGLSAEDVGSCDVTDRKLYLKVLSPRLQAVVRPSNLANAHGMLKEPQAVQAGFILQNSETGCGSFSIQSTIYKLMCTNLWVTEEAVRTRHIGARLENDDAGIVFKNDTRIADAQARLLKIRDHVTAALDEHKFLATVAKMQALAEIPLGTKIEKVVDNTSKVFRLADTEKEAVLRHLIEGADLSMWGLTNAVTRAAQDVPSYDRATELETIGGRFVSLTNGDMKAILG
jgi:hypothetical protein